VKTPSNLRRFLYLLSTLSFFYLALTPSAHAQTASSSYALTHAKIFTISGTPIEDGTVVIRDGKIAAIGASVDIPAGAQVIDAKGLQVYPGLFDSITQMGMREIGAVNATVDSVETGNYNPDVVAATAVFPSSEHIPVTRAAGITEVLAVPASGGMDSFGSQGVLGGQASAIHLAGWTIDEMLLKKSAAMVLNWPEIETQTFDFSTFTRKEKPYGDAKQEYDKQVNELTEWLDRARHYAQAMEKGAAAKYDRDLKL
jgi:imidazolonepropionase-like amidohydrolase